MGGRADWQAKRGSERLISHSMANSEGVCKPKLRRDSASARAPACASCGRNERVEHFIVRCSRCAAEIHVLDRTGAVFGLGIEPGQNPQHQNRNEHTPLVSRISSVRAVETRRARKARGKPNDNSRWLHVQVTLLDIWLAGGRQHGDMGTGGCGLVDYSYAYYK